MRNFTLQDCPLLLRRGIIPLLFLSTGGITIVTAAPLSAAITKPQYAAIVLQKNKAFTITGIVTDKNGQPLLSG